MIWSEYDLSVALRSLSVRYLRRIELRIVKSMWARVLKHYAYPIYLMLELEQMLAHIREGEMGTAEALYWKNWQEIEDDLYDRDGKPDCSSEQASVEEKIYFCRAVKALITRSVLPRWMATKGIIHDNISALIAGVIVDHRRSGEAYPSEEIINRFVVEEMSWVMGLVETFVQEMEKEGERNEKIL